MKTNILLILLALIASSCGNNKSSSTSPEGKRNSELTEDNIKYSLLTDTREDITFKEMSLSERRIIYIQARLALSELYVNRLKKMKTFGAQVDPIPKLERFEKDYLNASPDVFHKELIKIFASQQDHHTWYSAPAPAGCYTAFLPISFVPAKNDAQEDVTVVKSLRTKGNTLEMVPELKRISVGDILLSINDRSPKAEMASLNPYNSGANPPAFLRSAHALLSYRNQDSTPLPSENTVRLQFRKIDGEIYEISVPWLTGVSKTCLNPESEDSGEKKQFEVAENNFITEYENFYRVKKLDTRSKNSLIKSYIVTEKNFQDRSFTIVNSKTETREPTISWWTFKNEENIFGVINITSFSPTEVSASEAKSIIENLLSNELSNVDGVIYDLRNNGGGIINYGQSLAELATGKSIDALKFQLLNSAANRFYFTVAEPNSAFSAALKEAQTNNNIMTSPIYLEGSVPENLYKRGQVFFKPVAIFTNSNCYSTCDMMSALFQDHGLAEIWAEDAQTGAGGANNWNLEYLLGNLPKDNMGPFQKLPFSMNLGFAYRQTVRSGSHAGELLEDEGVKADFILPTTVEDVITGGKSQFVKISASLAAKKNKYLSWVRFNNNYVPETTTDALNIILDVKATDAIEVFYKKTKIMQESVAYSNDLQTITIRLPLSALPKNLGDIEIMGLRNGSHVWRKISSVRKTQNAIKLGAAEELKLNFKNGISPLIVYNSQKDESQGWYSDGSSLRIGNEEGYSNNVISTASLFVDLVNKENAKLNFNLQAVTEKNYDFVGVFIVAGQELYPVLPWASGEIATGERSESLAQFKGQKIEIRFVFKSDEAEVSKGVWIKNISVK